MANGWTAERKARQAELIGQWQPWKLSTGAKTAAGKAKSSKNAFKGGLMKQILGLRSIYKQFIKDIS